jgi:hypothetical protein
MLKVKQQWSSRGTQPLGTEGTLKSKKVEQLILLASAKNLGHIKKPCSLRTRMVGSRRWRKR